MIDVIQGCQQSTIKWLDSDQFCRSLPKMGQILEFAKIRVWKRVRSDSDDSDMAILKLKMLKKLMLDC
jgi:hypothetical protein